MGVIRRAALVCTLVTLAILRPSTVAVAQEPPAAIGFLVIAPQPVGDDETVTVTPSNPCRPPSAAVGPYAIVTDNGSDISATPRRLATVPIGPDGSWSATVELDGTGEHALEADCISGPQAEGSYSFYEPTVIDVVTRSRGYWVAVTNRQDPSAAGDAPDYAAGLSLAVPVAPVVGIAPDPRSGLGYWTVSSDGGVYTFGHSQFYGAPSDIRLAAPVVGMAATPTGHGYWIAAADGGVFTYGDAAYFGSGSAGPDRSPVVGVAATEGEPAPGYELAHSDGAVVEYSSAGARELNGPMHLSAPVVGIASTPSGRGYWLAASDGGVFAFGDAPFAGSLGGVQLSAPITAITSRADGGYWLLGRDGGIFSFGGAPFIGSFVASGSQFTGIAATPDPTMPT